MAGDEQPQAAQLQALVDALQPTPAGADRFTLPAPDWWGPRLFGGMVVAQAMSAALPTVAEGYRPHSLHGYFLRPVEPGPLVELSVERLRDGRAFALRQVTLIQQGDIAARMSCSFHVDEEGEEYQPTMPTDVPPPEELAVGNPPGPFDIVDAGPVPAQDGTYRSSGRYWNRTCGPLPDDPGLHVCVLALMSDMTRTSFRPTSLHLWGSHTDASIDHAVWFHSPARADEWLHYDLHAPVNRGNRAFVRGSMYSRDGRLVLSMSQELLVRPIPRGGQLAPWLAEVP
jgi:acyl-CoA thioesterase II